MNQCKLIYIHDPMCSWCWGYTPTWLKLKAELENKLTVEYKVGGLAPDSQTAMTQNMKERLESIWHKIESELGTQFNFDFWKKNQPRRSTYPACRAALIARKKNKESEMIEAIQHAYYLNAQNPSDDSVLICLAEQIGLNKNEFTVALLSDEVNYELKVELQYTRSLPIHGFPSLVFLREDKLYSIEINYKDWRHTYNQIIKLLD
ncbi:DsbA family protein [Pseudoalteromonas sp. SCSIO 43210]